MSKSFSEKIRSSFHSLLLRVKSFLYNVLTKSFRSVFGILPLSDTIVLECESDMDDNPMAFFEYLLKIKWNETHTVVWIVKNVDYCKSNHDYQNVKYISRYDKSFPNQVKFDYYIRTSKWFVFSHPYWLTNWRKRQAVICTTHSAAQLKQSGTQSLKHICDYVLSCSEYCQFIKEKSLGKQVQYLNIGMPRIDWMFSHVDVKGRFFPESSEKKLIVVMTTFRQTKYWTDSDSTDSFSLNVVHNEEQMNQLDKFLSDHNAQMIIKIHHLQNTDRLFTNSLSNILYLKDEDLLQEGVQVNRLLENADLLLTDYSSVFYDYLLTDRPIGFLISDMSDYSRGFIMDDPLNEMPGPKIYSFDELIDFLSYSLNGEDQWHCQREAIKNKVFAYCDNKNSERLLNWMKGNKK